MGVVLLLIAAVAGALWVAVSGWPPIIIRDRQYRELVTAFQQALPREHRRPVNENDGWEFQEQVPDKATFTTVQAGSHQGIITIKYEDEERERPLYKYVDYSSTADVRTSGSILYVHWVERFLRTDHWLLAYDLASRREIARRKVDPNDVRPSIR